MVIISRDVSMYPATLKTGHLIHFLKKQLNFFSPLNRILKGRIDRPAGYPVHHTRLSYLCLNLLW